MSIIVTIPDDPSPVEALHATVRKMQEEAHDIARRHEECVDQLAALSSDLTVRQERIEHFQYVIQGMVDQKNKIAGYASELTRPPVESASHCAAE